MSNSHELIKINEFTYSLKINGDYINECYNTIQKHEGLLGTIGVIFKDLDYKTYTEITTIPFLGDWSPQPNASSNFFKSS